MVQPLCIASIALLLEAAFGYPQSVYRLAGHPVSWIGALIAAAERRLNTATATAHRRRLAGVLAVLVVVGGPTACAVLLQRAMLALLPPVAALAMLGLLAATMPAQRSLYAHVLAVAQALERGGVTGGRAAVSMIVGRDTAVLDEAGVARAALESLSENFSDGVVAPLLWCAAFGLPGIVFYKAVNTADSMIGHLTPRYAAFGWAAARLDDAVNLPASRLTALWIVLAAPARAGSALAAIRRDAGRHRSPNAGWPESAMAGALGVRLAGPRVYDGRPVRDAWMGDGRDDCTAGDVRRGLLLYRRACVIQAACLLAVVALLASRLWA